MSQQESQASQLSDTYASSLFDIDRVDPLQTIPSDDISIPPDPYYPALSIASGLSESTFQRPRLPSLEPPSSIEQYTPDRIRFYLIYPIDMADKQEEFVQWWLRTGFGQRRRIHWNTRHSSAVWQHFSEVADRKTGAPKVKCLKCKALLDHPGLGNGTSTMSKHVRGGGCQRTPKGLGIKQFIQSV